jgi:hypothetical protein
VYHLLHARGKEFTSQIGHCMKSRSFMRHGGRYLCSFVCVFYNASERPGFEVEMRYSGEGKREIYKENLEI